MAIVSSAFDFYAGQFYFIYNKIHVMMFLQLAKTTPYLSGQWKIDICLNRSGEDAIADRACLTPLSPCIPWSNDNALPLENYTIGESMRHLYRLTKDTFYKDLPNYGGKLKIYDNENALNTYETDNIMGVRRSPMSRYNKQFAFLCPLWCEDADSIKNLHFVATVSEKASNVETQREASVRNIKLNDTIIRRFEEWLDGVNDEILRIDFEKMEGAVKGADPSTGTTITKECTYIVDNIISRERPLMEVDSMLCHAFSDNCVIAKQLINICFYFNLEDLVDPRFVHEFDGKCVNVSIEAYCGDDKLPLKDIFSNYDFIAKWETNGISGRWNGNENVLDYLKDTYCIDTIYENKTTQPIVHWSLTDNNEYIFNTYKGFNALVDKNKTTGGFYNIQANPFYGEFSAGSNNLNWLNVIDVRGYSAAPIQEIIQDNLYNLSTPIDYNDTCVWINCNKYNTERLNEVVNIPEGLHACIFVVDDVEDVQGLPSGVVKLEHDNMLKAFSYTKTADENTIAFVCDNTIDIINKMTLYNALKGVLKNYIVYSPETQEEYNLILLIIDFLKVIACYEAPIRIDFKKSVCCVPAASPNPETQEIYYTKGDFNCDSTIYRYSGKLRPTFIDAKDYSNDLQNWHNDTWHYDTFNDSTEWLSSYNALLNTGYLPEYMSIKFFGLNETNLEAFPVPVKYSKAPDNDFYDFTWYNTGWTLSLVETYKCTVTSEKAHPLDHEEPWRKLADYLGLNYDDKFKVQVKPLYNVSHNFDYLSNDNIDKIKHDFVFTLK